MYRKSVRCVSLLMQDQRAFVISVELVILATVGVIAMLVAFVTVRDAVTSEVSDIARAVQNLVQCYEFNAVQGHSSLTAGSDYIDRGDHCNIGFRDRAGRITNCIIVSRPNSIQDEA